MAFFVKNKNSRDFPDSAASEPSEAEWIQGLRDSQDWAFRRLVDTSAGRLFRLAFRFVGTKEDAEEVLQDVMQKIIEKIGSFEGGSTLHTWMHSITVNQSLMHLRKKKGKVFIALDDAPNAFVDGMRKTELVDLAKLPDEFLEQKEIKEFLAGCIEKLSDELKVAYLLKEVEALSEDDVCRILDITKPTMKNRVHRARLILRNELGKKYGH